MIITLRRRARPVVACLALVVLVPLAGCGGQGKVSGQVRYKDRPLPGGWLTFRPADPRENAVSVPIDSDGRFEATLPSGDVQIAVDNRDLLPPVSFPPPQLPTGIHLPPAEKREPAPAPAREPAPQKQAGSYVAIPEKYYLIETSGLRYTVKRGNQRHDILLE